jgi:nitrogen fixation/metabolism regulation signal transduction histidine kinase
MNEYLQELLLKFSLVFFSDINLYGTNGELLATSRPEVFDRNLIAPLMNPIAFNEMHFRKKIFFVQQEQISRSTYISSYIPFKNAAGEAVAYINLPSFARESEMQMEIRSLVLAYLNIFLLLASFMVAFALLLSRRLTQPLEMIQKKMQLVRIDKVNEKIVWNSRDEIGQLVNQYNNLLDQLQESAELLAKSERESAWREMAKQVAHEIKNPLTPMRLSIQYLERAWNDNDPDIDNKIRSTAQTIINQIDTLSTIASAFSDFAKMPVNQPIPLKVSKHVEETIRLFNSHQDVQFDFTDHSFGQITVSIDKDNFRRTLTNLIKNSIQAIGRKPNGWIHIELAEDNNNFCVIQIKDNGKGMSKEEMSKIFTPNFTTKSSGMGLGLSMVKNIIETAGGTITFESVENKGSIFTLKIPVLKEANPNK